jgi:hypothetical protein
MGGESCFELEYLECLGVGSARMGREGWGWGRIAGLVGVDGGLESSGLELLRLGGGQAGRRRKSAKLPTGSGRGGTGLPATWCFVLILLTIPRPFVPLFSLFSALFGRKIMPYANYYL